MRERKNVNCSEIFIHWFVAAFEVSRCSFFHIIFANCTFIFTIEFGVFGKSPEIMKFAKALAIKLSFEMAFLNVCALQLEAKSEGDWVMRLPHTRNRVQMKELLLRYCSWLKNILQAPLLLGEKLFSSFPLQFFLIFLLSRVCRFTLYAKKAKSFLCVKKILLRFLSHVLHAPKLNWCSRKNKAMDWKI